MLFFFLSIHDPPPPPQFHPSFSQNTKPPTVQHCAVLSSPGPSFFPLFPGNRASANVPLSPPHVFFVLLPFLPFPQLHTVSSAPSPSIPRLRPADAETYTPSTYSCFRLPKCSRPGLLQTGFHSKSMWHMRVFEVMIDSSKNALADHNTLRHVEEAIIFVLFHVFF